MPRSRRRLNSPAASAEPVEPPETRACARPSATARAAWTIEASGVERTANAGSAALAIEIGASTTSTLSGNGADLPGRTEQQHPDFAGRGGGGRSGRHLSGTEVRPASIDGNRDHRRGDQSVCSPAGAMTSRPL